MEASSKDVVESRPSSAYYFKILFRISAIYLLLNFFIMVPLYLWIGLFLLISFLYIFRASFSVISALASFLFKNLILKFFVFLKKCATKTKSRFKEYNFFDQLESYIGKWTRQKAFTSTEKREALNAIIVNLLIFSSICGSILSCIFISLQVVKEASSMVENSFSFLNTTVINNPSLSQLGSAEHLSTAFNASSDWIDQQLATNFPQLNMTSGEILDAFMKTQKELAEIFASKNSTHSNGLLTILSEKFPTCLDTIGVVRSKPFTEIFSSVDFSGIYHELFSDLPDFLIENLSFDQHAFDELWPFLKRYSSVVVEKSLENSAVVLGYISSFAILIVNSLLYSFTLLADLVLFITILSFLLSQPRSPVEYVGTMLAFVDHQRVIQFSVEKALSGIFITTGKLFTFHFVLTWLTLGLCGFPYIYMFSIVAGFLAIIPVTNPLIIIVVPVIDLYLAGHYMKILVLVTAHVVAWIQIDPVIYSDIPESHPYISSLSIVLGLYAFGVQGIFFGPLLACLPIIGYHAFMQFSRDANEKRVSMAIKRTDDTKSKNKH